MASINDVFGSAYLKADDLPEGQPVPVYIESVNVRDFDDGRKLEVTFKGKRKSLVCNKTNARSIAEFLGEENFERWPGQLVYLRRARTEFQGRAVPCVRVDLDATPAAPPENATSPQPASEPTAAPAGVAASDDIPF